MGSTTVTTSRLQFRAAKIGMAGKGVLYLTIGLIAARIALGSSSGEEASQTGAIRAIGEQPFGQVLLTVLAVALVGYALWRLIQAFGDPDEDSTAKAAVLRISYVIRALIYGGLAFLTVRVLTGSSSGSGGGGSQQATGLVLGLPGGRWLVGAAGVVVIGVGGYQAKKAWTAEFMEDLSVGGSGRAVERLGRAGHAARAIIYVLVGIFGIRAAVQYDASEARGLDGALQQVAQASYGTWLLLAVAAGLIAYGVYAFVAVRHLADPTA